MSKEQKLDPYEGINFVKKQAMPTYQTMKLAVQRQNENLAKDEMFIAAAEAVIAAGKANAKFLMERLKVGHKNAVALLKKLENFGVISASQGSQGRKVLVSTHEFFDKLNKNAA